MVGTSIKTEWGKGVWCDLCPEAPEEQSKKNINIEKETKQETRELNQARSLTL